MQVREQLETFVCRLVALMFVCAVVPSPDVSLEDAPITFA